MKIIIAIFALGLLSIVFIGETYKRYHEGYCDGMQGVILDLREKGHPIKMSKEWKSICNIKEERKLFLSQN